MALTKVNRGGLNTGISDSSDATFLTVDSSEQAVIKSEGGAATTSVQQGLTKAWAGIDSGANLENSFNVSSGDDVYLIRNIPIPNWSSFECMACNKLVMEASDKLQLKSDAASSLDVAISVLEQTLGN